MNAPKATKSPNSRTALEREFFRTLNRVIEPMVRAGIGSPRLAPGGLIVLETTGRKSGRLFRTPLVATRLGKHVLVATARGVRSQWVLNAAIEPNVRFWLGGRERNARAFVIHEEKRFRVPTSLPIPLQKVVQILAPYRRAGWAFALLSPKRSRAEISDSP